MYKINEFLPIQDKIVFLLGNTINIKLPIVNAPIKWKQRVKNGIVEVPP